MFLRFTVDQLEHEATSVNRVVANKTRGHKKSKDTAAEETTAPKGQKIIRVARGLIAKRNVDQHPNRLAQLHPAPPCRKEIRQLGAGSGKLQARGHVFSWCLRP